MEEYPKTLEEFEHEFATELACVEYLYGHWCLTGLYARDMSPGRPGSPAEGFINVQLVGTRFRQRLE
jgi:hypothetical protein